MTVEERYRQRYKSGDTPWDVGQPDFNLIEVVTKKSYSELQGLRYWLWNRDLITISSQNPFETL